MFIGLAIYAATSTAFPCSKALEALQNIENPAIEIMAESFGSDYKCLYRFSSRFSDRDNLAVVHITNEVCRRNKNCSRFELLPTYSVSRLNRALSRGRKHVETAYRRRIRAILGRLQGLQQRARLLLTTGLEDNFTPAAFKEVKRIILEETGGKYEIVRSKVDKQVGGNHDYFDELHAWPVKNINARSLYNFDGLSICYDERDCRQGGVSVRQARRIITERAQNAFAVFLWRGEWQGLDGGIFKFPRARKFRFNQRDVLETKKLMEKIDAEINNT